MGTSSSKDDSSLNKTCNEMNSNLGEIYTNLTNIQNNNDLTVDDCLLIQNFIKLSTICLGHIRNSFNTKVLSLDYFSKIKELNEVVEKLSNLILIKSRENSKVVSALTMINVCFQECGREYQDSGLPLKK